MKESSRERLAQLLMDELVERLASRDAVKKMLGDMTALPIEQVLEHLVSAFEKSVAEYHAGMSPDRTAQKQENSAEKPAEKPLPPPVAKQEKPKSEPVPREEPPKKAEEPVKELSKKVEEPVAAEELKEAAHPADVKPESRAEQKIETSEAVAKEEPAPPRVPPALLKLVPRVEEKVETPHNGQHAVITPLKTPEHRVEEKPAEKVAPAAEKPPEPKQPAPVEKEPIKKPEQTEPRQPGTAEKEAAKQAARPDAREDRLKVDPIKLDFPRVTLKDAPARSSAPPPEEIPARTLSSPTAKKEKSKEEVVADQKAELDRLAQLARNIEAEYSARLKEEAKTRPAPVVKRLPDPEPVVEVKSETLPEIVVEGEVVSETGSRRSSRSECTFGENEFVYVHAVSRIPEGEDASAVPFHLEEKGIDGHTFAFGFDYGTFRFYLSKVNPNEMSISKAMVLLLNKQESLVLQGVHESTLNDLRAHGILLPMEFGTVVRGKEQLCEIADINKDDLDDALDDLDKTTWWTVTAFALDATIAGIVGTDVKTVGRDRQRDRASYTSAAQSKKFDIKVLERILQREKKLAEAIHDGLCSVAEKSDLDTIVGLGSGSSEDWKLILKGAYQVSKKEIAKFNRAVTDLQYHHLQYELMLTVAGNKDYITLRRK